MFFKNDSFTKLQKKPESHIVSLNFSNAITTLGSFIEMSAWAGGFYLTTSLPAIERRV